ncbi:MAG TPA: hypothetical protein DHW82_00990 [Spirochaetia bacterium]|nr:hypothetical protein [Spirochaetia bacterium]
MRLQFFFIFFLIFSCSKNQNEPWSLIENPEPDIMISSFFISDTSVYIASFDENNFSLQVFRYDGKTWHKVGNLDAFRSSGILENSLFVYQDTPYLVFRDSNYAHRTSLIRFDGTNWEYVGSPASLSSLDNSYSYIVTDSKIFLIREFSSILESFDLKTYHWEKIPIPFISPDDDCLYSSFSFYENSLYLSLFCERRRDMGFGEESKPGDQKIYALQYQNNQWKLLAAYQPNSLFYAESIFTEKNRFYAVIKENKENGEKVVSSVITWKGGKWEKLGEAFVNNENRSRIFVEHQIPYLLIQNTESILFQFKENAWVPVSEKKRWRGDFWVQNQTIYLISEDNPGSSLFASKKELIHPLSPVSFRLKAGTYSQPQTLSLKAEAGASIYYTTDGSEPTLSHGIKYKKPITITQSMTVKAFSFLPGKSISETVQASYLIQSTLSSPSFSVLPGSYFEKKTVSLSVLEKNTKIYYTLDGSKPECFTSLLYHAPLVLSSDTLLSAVSCRDHIQSEISKASYSFPEPLLTPFFTDYSGSYRDPEWKDPLGRYYGNPVRFLAEISAMEIEKSKDNTLTYKYQISNLKQSPQAISLIIFVYENLFPKDEFKDLRFFGFFDYESWDGSVFDFCYQCKENGIGDEKQVIVSFTPNSNNIKLTSKKIAPFMRLRESNGFLNPGKSIQIEIPLVQKNTLPGLISIRMQGETESPSEFSNEEENLRQYLPGYKNHDDTKKFTAVGAVLKKATLEEEAKQLQVLLQTCYEEKWIPKDLFDLLLPQAVDIYKLIAEKKKTEADQALNEFIKLLEDKKDFFTDQAVFMMFKIRGEDLITQLSN